METLGHTIRRMAEYLAERGVDSPALSARLLVGNILGLDEIGLVRESGRELTGQELRDIEALVVRRGEGEPVAYILGEKEFYGLPICVGPGVLVPRPETELLIDTARRCFEPLSRLVLADLGTGSGCLAVSAAVHFPHSLVLAVDKSSTALDRVRDNAKRNGVGERLLPVLADFTHPFAEDGSLDLILANPPYVSDAEYGKLDKEVLLYEPEEALRCGPEGVEAGLELIAAAAPALKPGGILLMEIGMTQGERFRKYLEFTESPFSNVEILQDLAGLDRVVFGYKKM